ncbi:hypothetical protein IFM89_025996 [Coptis chinensis]|uniref:Uncharacterized protein n=1 Tax=Coptis chinensis TaxID=261450 RepID=A0A835LSH7_9MAGN|nr:hypothetical protein IFM89_025996 [Coptis chinensis]
MDERWVERDFLQLNGVSRGGSKRDIDQEGKSEKENEKKPKLVNLSLGLPDVSLSLSLPNRMPKSADVPVALRVLNQLPFSHS